MPGVKRRLLLVTSSGGVALDIMALRPWWSQHDVHWVSVAAPDTVDLLADQDVTWVDELRPSDAVKAASAVVEAMRVVRGRRPDLIVSPGNGVAVPFFFAAKLLGVSTWWIQTLNIVEDTGLASGVCSRLASRVLVQRPELLADYRVSACVGELY
jgi:hypothetical protein